MQYICPCTSTEESGHGAHRALISLQTSLGIARILRVLKESVAEVFGILRLRARGCCMLLYQSCRLYARNNGPAVTNDSCSQTPLIKPLGSMSHFCRISFIFGDISLVTQFFHALCGTVCHSHVGIIQFVAAEW